MNVLVAGASGLIGREVVRLLKEAGHSVRTFSRDPGRAQKLRQWSNDVRVGDATAPHGVDGLCDGIDVVVSSLGAPVSPSAKGKSSFSDVDRAANLALLAEAQRAKVRRYVYVGVHTAPSYAQTKYVRAHTEVEDAIRSSGLEFGFVRPTGVFGALGEFVSMAKKGPIPLFGRGEAVSNPVHEIDVAEALVVAVLSTNAQTETDIGGPEMLTRRRIGELAFQAVGRAPRLLSVPVWVMKASASLYGLANRRVGDFLDFAILVSTNSVVAPSTGKRTLAPYFEALAKEASEPRPNA